jgi:hypothetical protein
MRQRNLQRRDVLALADRGRAGQEGADATARPGIGQEGGGPSGLPRTERAPSRPLTGAK